MNASMKMGKTSSGSAQCCGHALHTDTRHPEERASDQRWGSSKEVGMDRYITTMYVCVCVCLVWRLRTVSW